MKLRNKNLSRFFALALSAGGVMAHADSLNGNGTWQNWSAANLAADGSSPNAGTPYWNNGSGDGPKANVGWCLAGGGSCSMPAGTVGAIPYYGNGAATASSMYFTSSGAPLTITLQTVMTTQTSTASGYDIFGFYLANSTGKAPSSASLTPLFDSRTNTPGTSFALTTLLPGDNYGFYIENVQGSGTPFVTDYFYFMDSSSNIATGSMPADALQHFATFDAGGGTYFLGDVDGDACSGGFQPGTSPCVPSSQFDYNNLMVQIVAGNVANTPEPASLALMGAGLCVVGAVLRRKKKAEFEN